MLINPFTTFGYESADYFCDRQKETRQMISQLVNGNHIALISPRRMGKKGLILHCFSQPELIGNYYTFLIDIYATKNLQDFVYQLGHHIIKRLKNKGQAAIDRFLQIVTSLRTGISFDGQGNPSWNLGIGDIKSATFTLEEIFSYLHSADRPCIVAIDEFQTISNYPEDNIEALLRTHVQGCRNATFIFSGSQQHMMSEMFSSPSRPFYQSVSMLFLKPVALQKYEEFAERLFNQYGKTIEKGVVKEIYDRFDGTTWYLQKMFNQLFSMTTSEGKATLEDVEKAEQEIIQQNEEAYKDIMYQLTIRQRDLLLAVGKERKATHITSGAFVKKHHLTSSSSVQKSMSILVTKQLLTHHQGTYEVYDKFFGKWLSKM